MLMLDRARFTIIVWILVACTQSLLFAKAAGPDETASKPKARQSFKFDPDDRVVLVPVRIGTKEYQFVLDTGCTGCVFDTSLRPYLGQRIDTIGIHDAAGHDLSLDLYAAPIAQVGSLPMRKQPVACYDCTGVREALGRDVYGILGMWFLKDWIITIDFDEGRIDFLQPGMAKQPAWGESVPCSLDADGSLHIYAKVGKDVETSFIVDTGHAGTGDIEKAFLTRLVNLHEARITGNSRQMTAFGLSSSLVTRLSSLSIGSFQHDNLRFSGGHDNLLGLGYLSRYRLTIDFPNERLYLAKGRQFADRDSGNTCGLFPLFKARGIEVESVDEKGPAYAAGVRTNDILVELCGKPVSALKQSEIYQVLREEGKPLKLVVERDGRRIEMSFTPYEYEEQHGENGVSAKPGCSRNDSQSGIPTVRHCPCRRCRTRRFAFGRLRYVEEVSRSGCGR